jgi:single-strand DNA-binding protein
MNYNKVILGGNITRDIELRYTPKGTAVCTLGIAVNRKWRDDSGAEHEGVSFHDCQAWGKTAEVIHQYFHKGRPIFIEGRLDQDEWEDKATGQKRTRLKVVGEQMQFLGSPQGGDRPAGGGGGDEEGGGYSGGSGGGGGGYSSGGGGGGGGFNRSAARPAQRPAPAQQRPAQRPAPAQQNDDFGEGPITDGMEDDDIPF